MDREFAVGLVDRDLGKPGQELGAAVRGDPRLQQLGAFVDERRGHVAGDEVGIVQDGLQERDVGGHAADAELGQGAAGTGHGGRVVAAAAGQLDQHRVEVRADLGARVDGAAVEPDAGAAGGTVAGDLADVGPEAVGRVLGGDAALQGCALELDRLLREAEVREGLPGGDAQLRLDEVDVGDFLGDGVLDLDARVHLDEHVLAGALPHGVDEELDGAGVDVVQGLGELHRVAVQRLPDAFVEVRRRGDLDDLLVPALDGTVTLEEVHDIALGVGQDLDLDVARAAGRPARGTWWGRRTRHRLRAWRPAAHPGSASRVSTRRMPRPPPPATALAKMGKPISSAAAISSSTSLDGWLDFSTGTPALRAASRAATLLPASSRTSAGGPDERDAGRGRGPGQPRVLGEEAVAGVNGVGPGFLGHADHFVDVQVRPDGVALLTDQIRLVGLLAVDRVPVLVGEHCDGLGTQFIAGAEGADRDFAAVGHQNLGKHTSPASSRAVSVSAHSV